MLLKMGTSFITHITANLRSYFQDVTEDAHSPSSPLPSLPSLAGPVLSLGGGGPDVENAIQWMINQVRGCTDCATKVNVIVIRTYGNHDYNRVINAMKGVKSVETLIVSNRQDANKGEILSKIRNADVIFFAGLRCLRFF